MAELRLRAEQALSLSSQPPNAEGIEQVLRELQLHQLELQMQNESLRELQLEGLAERDKYHELFELAPVPYLVLDAHSRVIECNRAGVRFLRLSADRLEPARLASFVADSYRTQFTRHIAATLASVQPQACDLSFRLSDGSSHFVHLESVRSAREAWLWRSVLVDLGERRGRELPDEVQPDCSVDRA